MHNSSSSIYEFESINNWFDKDFNVSIIYKSKNYSGWGYTVKNNTVEHLYSADKINVGELLEYVKNKIKERNSIQIQLV